jgi:hypothetical protein
VPTLRERLERGYGMRVQRLTEGALLGTGILLGDARPAALAFAMLGLQALVSPVLSPVALAWALVDRRVQPDRLGNLYFDLGGARGAAAVSCLVCSCAFALIHFDWPRLGLFLLAAPCASCLLSATVGFCAGCGYYVLGRDAVSKLRGLREAPGGAADVDLESNQ